MPAFEKHTKYLKEGVAFGPLEGVPKQATKKPGSGGRARNARNMNLHEVDPKDSAALAASVLAGDK